MIAWSMLPQVPGLASALRQQTSPPAALQQGPRDEEIERLRAMLAFAGPDGRQAREGAIERLLVLPHTEAHRVLQERLQSTEDPDAVRPAIVASLQRHWVLPPASQFGGATGTARERILADYVRVFAPMWRPLRGGPATPEDPLLAPVAAALQRLPARELDAAARAVLAGASVQDQLDVLRCLADMQQMLFAVTIAEYLDATDQALRRGAREALQLLTYVEPPLRTREQFAAWFEKAGTMRYVDLVQRAARADAGPLERLRQQVAQMRIEAARDVVRAHVSPAPGVDWAAIQARIANEDGAVLEACLEVLQQALPTLPEDASPARFALCRALLQRHRDEPAEYAHRRARLLEVAAGLGRPEEAELATELVTLLTAQLDATDPQLLFAALRALRRYPSVATRARLVALGHRLLAQQPVLGDRVAAVLATLTARGNPRWTAPLGTDADKADWLALVAACCRSDEQVGVREPALALAQLPTARDQRVPEVFDLLLGLVRDVRLPIKYRAACALHLQGWRNEPDVAASWVEAHHELLADVAPELRRLAAESLESLTDSVDQRRSEWLSATINEVKQRLPVEPELAVVRALVACMRSCGREPSMPEKAIGALRWVLTEMRYPVAPEHQFRLEPVLDALATIAADQRAETDQWLAACAVLSSHERRQSLRLVLQSHAAADLAKDVASTDASAARRARQAMQYLVQAALMKPAAEAWSASEELLREAHDVRRAFLALDGAEPKDRLDDNRHRLLRLEVDLATGKPQEVVQRASAWLGTGNGGTNGGARSPAEEQDRNRMRMLAASAQLALGRPDAARKLLEERTGDVVDPQVLELEVRIARALVATDLAGAVELLQRVVKRMSPEDPLFRARLLEWSTLRLQLDPAHRDDVRREVERHKKLFEHPDCPTDLREQWLQLLAR